MKSDHYFTPHPSASGRRRTLTVTLRGHSFRFATAAGVFSRGRVDRGTRLLIEHLEVRPADRLLDLGCGYGVIGIVAGRLAPRGRVFLVDTNTVAVELAAENIRINGLTNAVARQGDGFAPVSRQTFDVIAFNPPLRAGLPLVYRLIEQAKDRLSPSGRFYLVARTRQGAARLAEKMRHVFGAVDEVAKAGGYRVYLSRRQSRCGSDQKGSQCAKNP